MIVWPVKTMGSSIGYKTSGGSFLPVTVIAISAATEVSVSLAVYVKYSVAVSPGFNALALSAV